MYGNAGIIVRRRAVIDAHKSHEDTNHLAEGSDLNSNFSDAHDFSESVQIVPIAFEDVAIAFEDDHRFDKKSAEPSFMSLESTSSLRTSLENIVWDPFATSRITSSEKKSTSFLDFTTDKPELFSFSNVALPESLAFKSNNLPSSAAQGDLSDRRIGTTL